MGRCPLRPFLEEAEVLADNGWRGLAVLPRGECTSFRSVFMTMIMVGHLNRFLLVFYFLFILRLLTR
jgi:hypothetical protein